MTPSTIDLDQTTAEIPIDVISDEQLEAAAGLRPGFGTWNDTGCVYCSNDCGR